ncbi:hypothetical protein Zmor_017709 [Zophobas morio]|uniref:Protein takeout n=1 Tax=Zophobas morio TaxID=2755281 RepID=A0AA38ID12_9CUCU|nr:hypothetical protein Zmor_017709 [Zophobas morio]
MQLLILSVLFIFGASIKLPQNFLKCNRSDPDWKKCVFEAAVHAAPQFTKPFPELNAPNMDPYFIIELSISAGSKTIQMDQNFTNVKIYGLSRVEVIDFAFDFGAKTIYLEGIFPEIKMTGMYKFNGKVFLLPIYGEGPGQVIFRNLKANMTAHYEEKKKNGKTYIKVVSAPLKMIPGLIQFQHDNLFDGDKTLGDNINQVMNDNWQAVYKDIEDGYTQVVQKITVNLFNNFFSKLSLEEAFD